MNAYKLIVIGGGSAGFAAALKASELNEKVAIIETGVVGGTCLNVGCVPSKSLIQAAGINSMPTRNPYKGIQLSNTPVDFSKLIDQKNELLNELRQAKYIDIYTNDPNIDLIHGTASFIESNTIRVNDRTYSAEKFIISTGSSASVLDLDGLDQIPYLTNIEALDLKELPLKITILGGGSVAVEFAQMFKRLGSEVTMIIRSDRILRKEDIEIALALEIALENEGIHISKNYTIDKMTHSNDLITIHGTINQVKHSVTSNQLLVAAGRVPNTVQLNLENAGVALDSNGFIQVNQFLQTTAPNIYAAGDVIGGEMLVTIDAHEGSIAARNALNPDRVPINYKAVPHAIFTDPQIAVVGLTAEQAILHGFEVSTSVLPISLVPKAIAIHQTVGFVKMVIDKNTQQILGVHIISHLASEIIHEATIAIRYNMTIDDILDTIHVYPTMSESIKLVALSFRKDTSKLSCCAE